MDDGDLGVKLTSSTGHDIVIDTFTTTNATDNIKIQNTLAGAGSATIDESSADFALGVGVVNLSSSKGAITVSGTTTAFTTTTSSASTVAAVDISTVSGATSALTAIDAALDQISSGRGSLGAYQNRFESVVSSLQQTSENLSASQSRILMRTSLQKQRC